MHARVTERIKDFHAIFILNRNQACNATFWRKIFKNKLAYTAVIKVRSNQENLIKKDLEKERRKKREWAICRPVQEQNQFQKGQREENVDQRQTLEQTHGTIVADHDK